MAEDPGVLLKIAALNEAKKDFLAALDCLERASASDDVALRAKIKEVAERLEKVLKDPGPKARAHALTRGEWSAKPAPPVTVAGGPRTPGRVELELAREILVTPDVVRALRDALQAARAPSVAGSPSTAGATPIVLPVETILARLLACELDLARTTELALDLVLEATGAARGFMLVKNEKGRLEVLTGRGLGQEDLPPELSTSILAEAERTGEPVFLGDAASDPRFQSRESVQGLGLRSVACVPIVEPGESEGEAPGELLGLVYLDDPRVRERFQEKAKTLLKALARTIAAPIRNARRFEAQRKALVRARAPVAAGQEIRIVGRSKAIRELLDLVARVAPEDVAVLVEGESGTGKELTARVLHDLSPRRVGPFVAENLGALPATLVEAELFGVVRGAFTGADRDRDGLFQRASTGTLFLDEVGELPLEGQAKLLRALQEREVRPLGGEKVVKVDVRVVAATNRDLGAMVRQGKFREDLYYRLRVVAVRVPPLRERLEDIPLLAEHVLEKIGLERGEPVTPLSRAALARLAERPWPGNVRELENVLWRVALSGEGALDGPASAPGVPLAQTDGALGLAIGLPGEVVALEDARTAFDRAYLTIVLARSGNNVARAARSLGVTRPALSRILKRLGIERA